MIKAIANKFFLIICLVGILSVISVLLFLLFGVSSKPDNSLAQLGKAEEAWRKNLLTSYEMEVEFSGAHLYRKINLIVENNHVVEKKETCPMSTIACTTYDVVETIDSVFILAKIKTLDTLTISKILFDTTYHYPKTLFYAKTDSYGEDDADFTIEITKFIPHL